MLPATITVPLRRKSTTHRAKFMLAPESRHRLFLPCLAPSARNIPCTRAHTQATLPAARLPGYLNLRHLMSLQPCVELFKLCERAHNTHSRHTRAVAVPAEVENVAHKLCYNTIRIQQFKHVRAGPAFEQRTARASLPGISARVAHMYALVCRGV